MATILRSAVFLRNIVGLATKRSNANAVRVCGYMLNKHESAVRWPHRYDIDKKYMK